MRYLITGGAGFVGSHLAECLLGRGEEVLVLDDLSTGAIHNIDPLKERKGFQYIIDSVFNEPVLAEAVDRCDMVYHLAAAVGVRLIVESPVRTIETNIGGTEIVLRLANKKKKPVILTSTSEVYGKNENVPFTEDMDMVFGPTTRGRWSYACSKAIDEFLALAYWRERKLPTVVVRLFNTVGPRQTGQYGMVVPRFVRQGLGGGPITVYGDGLQSRSFGYVGDVVTALADLPHRPGAYGQVFNLGNDQEISIRDLAQKVRERTDPRCEIRFIPYEEAYGEGFEDMRRRVPDLSRIQALLGYRPTTGIDRILDLVIEWMRTAS